MLYGLRVTTGSRVVRLPIGGVKAHEGVDEFERF